MLTIILILMV